MYLIILLGLLACQPQESKWSHVKLDVQGHRGARGLFPENSLTGFKGALDIGVSTLELNVCMSSDAYIVVSHEPWMNADICINMAGERIPKEDEQIYNLYQMSYHAIANYDCGSIGNPEFPNQQKVKSSKPTLERAVLFSDQHAQSTNRVLPHYNIEIKRRKGYDNVFHPSYQFFAQSVIHEIQKLGIQSRSTVQSFDVQTLEYIYQNNPEQPLALRVFNDEGVENNLKKLSFTPVIYSPSYTLLTEAERQLLKKKKIKVIPWTVNETVDMERMLELDVDGIITDYPNRLMDLLK